MRWLKVWKRFRGGASKPSYIQSLCEEEDEGSARDWAERSPGDHEAGWTVYWEEVDSLPVDLIEDKIIREVCRIHFAEIEIYNLIEELKRVGEGESE